MTVITTDYTKTASSDFHSQTQYTDTLASSDLRTPTQSFTRTPTLSLTRSRTPTQSYTRSFTPTRSFVTAHSVTPTQSFTRSVTPTQTYTPTQCSYTPSPFSAEQSYQFSPAERTELNTEYSDYTRTDYSPAQNLTPTYYSATFQSDDSRLNRSDYSNDYSQT